MSLWQVRAWLYVAWALARLGRALRAPLTLWEGHVAARRDHELALVRLQLEAQHGMVTAMADLMKGSLEGIAQAQAAQQDLFKTWLEGFKTTDLPTSTTIREEDEIRMAMEREADWLQAQGVPVSVDGLWRPAAGSAAPAQTLAGMGIDVEALRGHLETT